MAKMKIGIIGAGELGGTLVRLYSKAGHQVKMTNHSGIEKLVNLANETGALTCTINEVVTDVDAIILSIPLTAMPKLSKGLFKNIPDKTPVIDTCNYYPIRDGLIEEIEAGMPESVWVSNQIKKPVVKVYNTILYRSLISSGLPKGAASRLAIPISGDNKVAKELASTLVDDCGFDPMDIGSLQDSWRQQPGSPIYCTDLTLIQLKNSVKKAKKELLPDRRELGLKFILQHDPELWQDNVIHNRQIYESDI